MFYIVCSKCIRLNLINLQLTIVLTPCALHRSTWMMADISWHKSIKIIKSSQKVAKDVVCFQSAKVYTTNKMWKAVKGRHAGRPRKTSSKHQEKKLKSVHTDLHNCDYIISNKASGLKRDSELSKVIMLKLLFGAGPIYKDCVKNFFFFFFFS